MIIRATIFILTFYLCSLCYGELRPTRNYKFRSGSHGVPSGQEEEEDSLPFYIQSGESDERMPLPLRVSGAEAASSQPHPIKQPPPNIGGN